MRKIILLLNVVLLVTLVGCTFTGFGLELKSGGKDYYLGYENQGDSLKPLRHQSRKIILPPVKVKKDSTLQSLKHRLKAETKTNSLTQ